MPCQNACAQRKCQIASQPGFLRMCDCVCTCIYILYFLSTLNDIRLNYWPDIDMRERETGWWSISSKVTCEMLNVCFMCVPRPFFIALVISCRKRCFALCPFSVFVYALTLSFSRSRPLSLSFSRSTFTRCVQFNIKFVSFWSSTHKENENEKPNVFSVLLFPSTNVDWFEAPLWK